MLANNPEENEETTQDPKTTAGRQSYADTDLPDSDDDKKHMQQEEVIFELPDVEDIPGQEHIYAPVLGELADTTISSDDEEGIGLFEEDIEDEDTGIIMGTEADVTPAEEKELKTTEEDMPTEDDSRLREAALDNTDFEGEPLNEGSSDSDLSGEDLDTAVAEDAKGNDALGQGDEENDTYSLGGDEMENLEEDSQ